MFYFPWLIQFTYKIWTFILTKWFLWLIFMNIPVLISRINVKDLFFLHYQLEHSRHVLIPLSSKYSSRGLCFMDSSCLLKYCFITWNIPVHCHDNNFKEWVDFSFLTWNLLQMYQISLWGPEYSQVTVLWTAVLSLRLREREGWYRFVLLCLFFHNRILWQAYFQKEN